MTHKETVLEIQLLKYKTLIEVIGQILDDDTTAPNEALAAISIVIGQWKKSQLDLPRINGD